MFSLIIDFPSGYGSMSISGSFFRVGLSREQIYVSDVKSYVESENEELLVEYC